MLPSPRFSTASVLARRRVGASRASQRHPRPVFSVPRSCPPGSRVIRGRCGPGWPTSHGQAHTAAQGQSGRGTRWQGTWGATIPHDGRPSMRAGGGPWVSPRPASRSRSILGPRRAWTASRRRAETAHAPRLQCLSPAPVAIVVPWWQATAPVCCRAVQATCVTKVLRALGGTRAWLCGAIRELSESESVASRGQNAHKSSADCWA